MNKKMILSGGTGYLGNLIQDYFKEGYNIFILTRTAKPSHNNIHYIPWDGKQVGVWAEVLENADVVINLAGKSINTQFTEENKKGIIQSRIQSTEAIGKAISTCKNPPKMWLNASSVAIYKESQETSLDEMSMEYGDDFLSNVSQKWEEAFYKYKNDNTKKAIFRISLILGDSQGSAYHSLKKLVKLGGGGAAGSGQQMVSWMGEKDFVRALDFIIHNQLEGPFNFGNPSPISNAQLMHQIRKKYQVPFGLPAPEWMIKLGAKIIGTAPELILRSQNTVPKRLIDQGFVFTQNSIADI